EKAPTSGALSTMMSDSGRSDRRTASKPTRQRGARDDAIRKKVEQELSRKTGRRSHHSSAGPAPSARRHKPGSVSSLRPAPAIIIMDTSRIVQAAQLMAAKRADAVLAVNAEGALVGILTDKDIAYRVVAEGLDLRTTLVSDVMTQNPISVYDTDSRNGALDIMVRRRFRHLPVISEAADATAAADDEDSHGGSDAGVGTSVVGLLDITKCVFERLDDLERKVNEDRNIISAMEALERRGSLASEHVGVMRSQHGCPSFVPHCLLDLIPVSFHAFFSSVREAARAMRQHHQTAVLVINPDSDEKVAGIFTTKDIVLRVLAASLDPITTTVVRVMTPHPDSANSDMSIFEALKKLYVGHYLHLPVIDSGVPVGLVDVMTLTISMLTYLMSKDARDGAAADASAESGPMWNKFWNSTFAGTNSIEAESDRLSIASDSIAGSSISVANPHVPYSPRSSASHLSHQPRPDPLNYHRPDHSVIGSVAPSSVQPRPADEGQFSFKLKDIQSGKVFRFTARSDSLADLVAQVRSKFATDPAADSIPAPGDAAPQEPLIRLSYLDDEGDIIHLASDRDLEEGVSLARRAGLTRLMLYAGDP
ncbi:hypothetical protein BDK51DRAFT_8880, partial [Blyttiomyces helicus]